MSSSDSPYAAAHLSPNGPGDARPTADQIILDQKVLNTLHDKTILITGCSAGIGIETAKSLHKTGARLFLTVRDIAKGRAALADSKILVEDGGRAELLEMDLSSLESVRKGAETFLKKSPGGKLNILIENAGIMAVPTRTLTADGKFELHFATNHLGHFLLFHLLKDALLSSSTPTFNSRVIILSSAGHRVSGINDTGNYNYELSPESYHPFVAYGQSKTANIYMACELERRYGSKGLHAFAVHPGVIITTGLGIHIPRDGDFAKILSENQVMKNKFKSAEQGAATTVYAAIGKEWEGRGGLYLADCAPAIKWKGDEDQLTTMGGNGYSPHIYNEELEGRLWRDSLEMVGISE